MSGEGDAADPAPTAPEGVSIEPAAADDRLDVLRVLDAAILETDADRVADRIDAGDVLVARFIRTGAVAGALVATRPEPGRLHVDAVAVRRARRGRGIGSALVAGVVERAERDDTVEAVTAAFDPKLRGFYTDLGFAVDRDGDNRSDDDRDGDGIGDNDRDDDTEETDRVHGRLPVGEDPVDERDDPESGERRR